MAVSPGHYMLNMLCKLNAFQMRCLRRIVNITWQDKVPNNTILMSAGIPTMYSTLKQRRMRWLGHVVRMEDDRIPRDILYGELVQGKRPIGRPKLRFKDICKRDLKALNIDLETWEAAASDRAAWRRIVQDGLSRFEETLAQQSVAKRLRRKNETQSQTDRPALVFPCVKCGRECKSRIGHFQHTRHCTKSNGTPTLSATP